MVTMKVHSRRRDSQLHLTEQQTEEQQGSDETDQEDFELPSSANTFTSTPEKDLTSERSL